MPLPSKASNYSTGSLKSKSTKPKRASMSSVTSSNSKNERRASMGSTGSSKNGLISPLAPKSILKKTSTTNKKTHNKRITFHSKKKTKRIPNLNSMPDDILKDIWWASDDYDEIMRSFDYTVFMMEAGEGTTVDDGSDHCTRGLELRTEAGKWTRFEHKRDCYNAVLDEQDKQWNSGKDNPEQIANCCREVTAKTQRIACRKGMQDERDIADFVADTRALMKKKRVNGKTLPSRTKSNSTGQLKRQSSNKTRIKSPPRKPERVLSGKSERGESNSSAAPRTPKRSISSKSSDSSTKKSLLTPTNSTNLQRMPQRQTFSNNSPSTKSSTSKKSLPPKTNSTSSSKSLPPKSNSTSSSKGLPPKTTSTSSSKKKSINLPKIPKRSASNNSSASNLSALSATSTESGGSTGSGGKGGRLTLNKAASAKFGG